METPPERLTSADPGDQAVDRRFALHLLGVLSHRQRAAVVMSFFHDLDDEQIAQTLGCRPGTARSLVSRGLAAMRSESQRMDASASLPGGLT